MTGCFMGANLKTHYLQFKWLKAHTIVLWRFQILFEESTLQTFHNAFNEGMSCGRVTVECVFKEIKAYFTTVDFERKMKLQESPVGCLHLSAMTLYNLRAFLYPLQTSIYFQCPPSSIEKYIVISESYHQQKEKQSFQFYYKRGPQERRRRQSPLGIARAQRERIFVTPARI